MKSKEDLIAQTRVAFELLEKVYMESSFLIREIEGMLSQEPEKFVMGRPAGDAISARSSRGLEPSNVPLWLIRRFSVFFVPADKTKTKGGLTQTEFSDKLKLIYVRIVFNDKKQAEPHLYCGVFYNLCRVHKQLQKFENVMGLLEYNEEKIFKDIKNISYDDAYVRFKGKLISTSLFDIKNSDDIQNNIALPTLKIFREI